MLTGGVNFFFGRLFTLFVTAAFILVGGTVAAENESVAADALKNYVAKPDDSYAWRIHARYRQGSTEVLELRMYSQTWRDILWKHQLYIIKPRRIETEGHGLLLIGGGRWRDAYETEVAQNLPEDARLFIRIAKRLRTVVAVLGQVPYQPLFNRTEDRIIAYTFDQYLRTGESDWPLLLPMVKSAVRAMDATQEATATEWTLPLETFTVFGGSKRGWTTWLTGAVDQRVTALVPAAIDVLNFASHFPHQTAVWGSPSEEIRPYTELNLHHLLSSEEGRTLRDIVDPFSYRSVLTQPKLIIIGTNDRYFPVDSLNLYWDDLPYPKYALYLPNEQHSAKDYRRLLGSLKAVHNHAALGTSLPELSWEFQGGNPSRTLCVHSNPKPRFVYAWTATSSTRDFRDAIWSSERLRPKKGLYVFKLPQPAIGYSAVYAEAIFGWGRSKFYLSSNLSVLGSPGTSELGRPASSHAGICRAGDEDG
jgi:PhoPQ-activated pathogenicity-related protein